MITASLGRDSCTGHRGKRVAAVAAVAIALLLGACATDRQLTVGQGALGGAGIGAVLGGVLRGGDGAKVGAVAGGVIGAVYGNTVAGKKDAYASREDALQAENAQARKVIDEAKTEGERARVTIAQLQQVRQRLQTEQMNAQVRRQLIADSQRQARMANGQLDQQIVRLQGEIVSHQRRLQEEKNHLAASSPASPAPVLDSFRLVAANLRELEGQQRALERAKLQLQQIDSRRAY